LAKRKVLVRTATIASHRSGSSSTAIANSSGSTTNGLKKPAAPAAQGDLADLVDPVATEPVVGVVLA